MKNICMIWFWDKHNSVARTSAILHKNFENPWKCLTFHLPSNRFVSKPNYAWETLHRIDQDMYVRIYQDVPFFFFLITDHNSYPSNEGFGSHHDTADQCGWRHQPRFQSWRPDDYSWSHRYARLNWRMRSSGSKWWEV